MKPTAMRRHTPLAALALLLAAAAAGQAGAPTVVERLTGPESRLESDLRVLTDEIGGRVTGSPGYERALRWGIDAFRRAAVDSVRLERYPVPAKWEAVSASARVLEPASFSLRVVSFGLAPSTSGTLTAPVVDAGFGKRSDFERLGAAAKGAIALVRSKPMTSFEDLFAEYESAPEMMRSAVDAGAAAILFVSTRPRDLLYRHTITWGTIAPIPMAQVAREDGLRLARLIEAGARARAALEIRNVIGGPWQASNVVAEIRGSEKPEEIVLLGAHLDAWDLGTGALDNGVNCALVVEVARAVAQGPRPRRTIRFVLFTSEETGLLGSRGYARTHRDELSRHVAVVIHDIGDGKVVGYFTNGRPDLGSALQGILAPAAPWGAGTINEEALLGTDNFDFLLEGVPNLVANQETDRYLADYHAESDTFDKIDLERARRNAAVAAIAVLGIANAPARLGPRQSRDEVEKILRDPRWRLVEQMKAYGLWSDWESGERGRAR